MKKKKKDYELTEVGQGFKVIGQSIFDSYKYLKNKKKKKI